MKKYIITLTLVFAALTGKAITKAEVASELVYKDRAYTWFVNEYKRGLQKVYGNTVDTTEIIDRELTKHENLIKSRLVAFYEKHLTKGEMLSLTMPFSMLKPRELARLTEIRSAARFLTINTDIAESIGTPLIAKLDIHTWTGTDKLASVQATSAKSLSMK